MKRSGTYDKNMQSLAAQEKWNPQANAAGYGAQADYQNNLINYQNNILAAQQAAKQAALRQAYENNTQSLNSQQGTVNNAYTSAVNAINATKQAQLPQYQQQRNAASADAAQAAQKVKELMAATGRYNSGMNRSQQLAVELAKQNAIAGANTAENQFNTEIGNKLSDAENQKATALADIASKLQLLQQQYNQGTLDLANQIASEKAAASSKAILDAQTWADQQRQQEIDNSFRQGQFDFNKWLQTQQFDFNKMNADRQYNFDVGQLLGNYNGSPTLAAQQLAQNNNQFNANLDLQKQQLAADQAYKNAALAASAARANSSSSANLSAIKYQNDLVSQQALAQSMQRLQDKASNGATRSEILKFINSNAGDLQANGVPVQELYSWASKNFTWDKNSNGDWYNTAK